MKEKSGEKQITVNRLPALTWYWLGMNDVKMKSSAAPVSGEIRLSLPEEVTMEDAAGGQRTDPACGGENREDRVLFSGETAGKEDPGRKDGLGKLIEEAGIPTKRFSLKAGCRTADPLALTFRCAGSGLVLNDIQLNLEDGSSLTVLEDFLTAESAENMAGVRTSFRLGKGAVLRLIQIQKTGSRFSFVNELTGSAGPSARIELVQLFLGGGTTAQETRIDLDGARASFRAELGYQLRGEEKLNISYAVNHRGKKTECGINAAGVLRDRSEKLFAGTIDFKKGSSGASGHEKEDVLLIDEQVRNRTIPVILCSEEDVAGSHGATIGRLDEDVLFYLQSRGMDRESVYEMMAQAKLNAVIERIPVSGIQREARCLLGGSGTDAEGDREND